MLEVSQLGKSYGSKKVLDGLSFSCYRGRVMSLLGSNGSGKSTTFRIIMGLAEADSGSVSLDYGSVDRRRMGYLPEERSLFYDCSVERQLRYFAALKGKKKADDEIRRWLERCGLYDHLHSLPVTLSKGNQQKLQLIACLIGEPELVIMDEPFTGLDQDNAELFLKVIRELKERNCMVLISSHIYQPVNEICDDFVYLHKGRAAIRTSREEIASSPYRVILFAAERGFFLTDEGILREKRQGRYLKYIVENDDCCRRIVNSLNSLGIQDFLRRGLVFEDLLEEL